MEAVGGKAVECRRLMSWHWALCCLLSMSASPLLSWSPGSTGPSYPVMHWYTRVLKAKAGDNKNELLLFFRDLFISRHQSRDINKSIKSTNTGACSAIYPFTTCSFSSHQVLLSTSSLLLFGLAC